MLHKLRTTENLASTVVQAKRQKKSKKQIEEKPTLIVTKKNGEYHVELQVNEEDKEGRVEHYNPLIYKIASANNEEKIKKRERKTERLIQAKIKEVWKDPYHPEVCEKTCMKAYRQAIGLLPFDPNNPECPCEEEEYVEEIANYSDAEESSDCSSLDLDWEIHFTPPIDCR